MKKFNKFCIAILITIVFIAIAINISRKIEQFGATSPGTLVQLASSHVPTQEDLDYYTKTYPKVVRKEVWDMTGEDPGNIALYPFQ